MVICTTPVMMLHCYKVQILEFVWKDYTKNHMIYFAEYAFHYILTSRTKLMFCKPKINNINKHW